jgi:hypothetical protein
MRKFVAGGFVVAALLGVHGPAWAGVAEGHCPPPVSGYIYWDVTTEPYQADNNVDEQGNNNGVACALPTKKTFELDGVVYTIYNFIDDAGAVPR